MSDNEQVTPFGERSIVGKVTLVIMGILATFRLMPKNKRVKIQKAFGNYEEDISEPTQEDDTDEEFTDDDGNSGPQTSEQIQQMQSAPSWFNEDPLKAELGPKHQVRAFWTEKWPNNPQPPTLSPLIAFTNRTVDVAMHIDPFEHNEARQEIDSKEEELKTQDTEGRDDTVEKVNQMKDAEALHSEIDQGNKIFKFSMYTVARGRDEEELADNIRQIENITEEEQTSVAVSTYSQKESIQSTSPIGKDVDQKWLYANSRGISATFPFTTSPVIEYAGVLFGEHYYNQSPVIYDVYENENGYNRITFGKIGAGKTFSAQLIGVLRTKLRYDNAVMVMVDPLQDNFRDFTEIMGGVTVTVGGDQSINPLELKQIDPEIANRLSMNPFKDKIDEVMQIVDRLFRQNGYKFTEDKRDMFRRALISSYKEQGIEVNNIESYSNPSPTMRDVIAELEKMEENIEKYVETADETTIKEKKNAVGRLMNNLSMFKEGRRYGHLGKETEVDVFADEEDEHFKNDIVYLDLAQTESNGGGVMTQVVLNQIYEHAKITDRKVVLTMDEAHLLLDQKNEEVQQRLQTMIRHSRHYDMSMHFITQEISDFTESQGTKSIVNNCSTIMLHYVEDIDQEAIEMLGLNDRQVEFIQQAESGGSGGDPDQFIPVEGGKEVSEALLYIDKYDDWIPLEVRASEFAKDIITYSASGEQEEVAEEML